MGQAMHAFDEACRRRLLFDGSTLVGFLTLLLLQNDVSSATFGLQRLVSMGQKPLSAQQTGTLLEALPQVSNSWY